MKRLKILGVFTLVMIFAVKFGSSATPPVAPSLPTWEGIFAEPQIQIAVRPPSPDFFIATDGNDAWSGRFAAPNSDQTDGPFATFAKAQCAMRGLRAADDFTLRPTVVQVAGGLYELDQPISFTVEDSGSPDAPAVWCAAPNAEVRLSAGRFLHRAKPITEEKILERLKLEVRDKIVEIDLRAHNVTDWKISDDTGTGPELFFDGCAMTVARYPNDGFLTMGEVVLEGTTPTQIHGVKGIVEGVFHFDDEELLSWQNENDLWVLGYWFWDWANSRQKIESLDTENKILKLAPPNHGYGYRSGQWFYAYNVLRELDTPGEYFIDAATGILYFYPPESLDHRELLLTVLPSVITTENVSGLVFSGFTLEGARGTTVSIHGGTGVVLANSTVRNGGGTGASLSGTDHRIFNNTLYNLGAAGVSANGGDRQTLTPGNLAIVNNTIHDYGRVIRMYAAGVGMNGVGNYIANNKITDAPHCAILFGGNDMMIEQNEIARVCLESNDAGAIYCGRNWTMRGNCVKNNFLHDITGFRGEGCVGVYLDDMFSSCDMIGNLHINVTRASFIGGGRDNNIVGNIYIDCKPALHIDARALGWCYEHADEWLAEAKEKGTILGIAWNKPPYSERYPKLATILESDNPKAPEGNLIARNIAVGGTWDVNKEGQWRGDSVEAKARPYLTFEDNLVDEDPLFVDAATGDYNLKPESPAWKIGFEPIPFDKIGPRKISILRP